uniref:Uncharacterized protein n=1 Tax=mine drainage metagenome TaxID=410659 RepID=E6Q8X1_9ZZZZ
MFRKCSKKVFLQIVHDIDSLKIETESAVLH